MIEKYKHRNNRNNDCLILSKKDITTQRWGEQTQF